MVENRRALRFECDEKLVCKQSGVEFGATVIDISRGGMKIHSQQKLEVGSKLFLHLKDRARGRAPVKAVVRWVLLGPDYQVGLEFEDSAGKLSRRWVRKLFPDEGAAWTSGHQQRSEVRAVTSVPIVAASGFIEGKACDLSSTGASFELPQKLENTVGLFLCLPWAFLEVRANVLRAEKRGDNWLHSVQFSVMRERDKEALEAFVEHQATGGAFLN